MKIGRYLLYILVGGVIGGIIGGLLGETNGLRFITEYHLESHTVIQTIGIGAILCLLGLIVYILFLQKKALKYKNQLDAHIEEDIADTIETKASLKFINVSLVIYLAYLIAFLVLLIYVVANVSDDFILYPIIAFLTVSIGTIPYSFFIRKYDPRLPKLGEKHYTEKMLVPMDEGERHITLVSMFKIYYINLCLLIIGIFLLGIFSILSGVNQTFGLIILILLFAYNTFGYLLRMRQYYQ
ncbi:DUF3169 family protein [Staphylococcus agnetis]|uniref:DUF3169 family protein n=1 Tax=Staphylococcus agnetis TaxID=985762 RepID=UPI000CD1E207|nr:DUF3169 family protein [Staphylococcus agnetis]MBY7664728.1 DUF3169 family protein [Staphylococcus agnetis]NJH67604.1 DUF3169 family protein [Staphylococcus agnetis]NJH78300.1 DUF3169 family protein [Staphylococcus agnetis]PNY87320.1 DUF3169 domain-containing protein [Staphylococcus agnetis]PTH68008.1 DUF3169 domain-containing protein [Staphylococcus agnetis]